MGRSFCAQCGGLWYNLLYMSIYNNVVKRTIDIVLAGCGIVVLGVPMLVIAAVVKHEDPGPALFKQKRVAGNVKKSGVGMAAGGAGVCGLSAGSAAEQAGGQPERRYFMLYKFRSMKMSTPHDVPTAMLENPEQYILKSGKTLRKYSLDELPQMFNILKGDMSIIGPRPALWNQEALLTERDAYGANDIRPGLTGWAQINGRDELEDDVKAAYDGEYAKALKQGGMTAFCMDAKCFFGTIGKVLRHEGVVEGGTGEMKKRGEA